MSPRSQRVAILGSIAVVLCLVLGSIAVFGFPAPNGSNTVAGVSVLDDRFYSYENLSIFGPAWSNYTYRGVTFSFHLWCEITPAAGKLCGNATESNHESYPYAFWDGLPTRNPQWQTWVAPDYQEAVQYLQGGTVHLLVLE